MQKTIVYIILIQNKLVLNLDTFYLISSLDETTNFSQRNYVVLFF
jgi:hypothetical protein